MGLRPIRSRRTWGDNSASEPTTRSAADKDPRVRPVLVSPTLAMPAALAAATSDSDSVRT